MTRHLLDLPEEILDECLEELLPPLRPHNGPVSLRDLKCTPEPVDLCRVMLTCRTLHSLAYPWVWRRVHFNGRRGRCTYLCDHPEAAAHVRIFIINWDSESAPTPQLSPISLVAFRPAIQLMNNLRVLSIRVLGPHPCLSEILKELISKPRLHTLLSFQPPEMACVMFPLSLQRLCYSANNEGFNCGLADMPRLHSLALVNSGVIRRTLPIPWEKLGDLEISGIDSWRSVFENFSTWKAAFPSTIAPLTEVALHMNYMKSDDMWRFIDTFKGQALRSLFLSYVPSIEGHFLRKLVEEFPDLRTLGLCTGGWCRPWPCLKLVEILETLGRLRHLKVLRWNYGPDHLINLSGSVVWDRGFREVISAVADYCTTLERVEFHHSRFVYYYERQRDGCFAEAGSFKSVDILQNSSWSRDRYDKV